MRTLRLKLIAAVALAAALGLALFWLLMSRPARGAADAGTRARPAAEQPRPEIGAGREFRLEEFLGYDPALAPWLDTSLEKYPPAGDGRWTPEQVAGLPKGQEGGGAR